VHVAPEVHILFLLFWPLITQRVLPYYKACDDDGQQTEDGGYDEANIMEGESYGVLDLTVDYAQALSNPGQSLRCTGNLPVKSSRVVLHHGIVRGYWQSPPANYDL